MEPYPLLPPWLKYPEIKLGSAAWRMGYGEDYWYEWKNWFRKQSAAVQSAYEAQYPEPETWRGFYKRSLE